MRRIIKALKLTHVRRSREVRMVVLALPYIQKVTRHTRKVCKEGQEGCRGGEKEKKKVLIELKIQDGIRSR